MEKEFNLSEKVFDDIGDWRGDLTVRDVKEFIKLELKLIRRFNSGRLTWSEFIKERNQLAGEKLANG